MMKVISFGEALIDMLSNRVAALDDRDQLEAILDLGMRCGAFTVTRKGAFDALPTQADLNAESRRVACGLQASG
jgi:sugar/nucleoside kinase (ribokinase family)